MSGARYALSSCEMTCQLLGIEGLAHPVRRFSRDATAKAERRAGVGCVARFACSVRRPCFLVDRVWDLLGEFAVLLWHFFWEKSDGDGEEGGTR